MLVDIGRVDVEVRRNPARLAAYKLAVEARTPFPTGTRFRLRGPWGADDATINGFDTWNGRIVATVATTPRVDSLAKAVEPLPATAQLVDSANGRNDGHDLRPRAAHRRRSRRESSSFATRSIRLSEWARSRRTIACSSRSNPDRRSRLAAFPEAGRSSSRRSGPASTSGCESRSC